VLRQIERTPVGDEGKLRPGRRSAGALLAAGRRDGVRHECELAREDRQVDNVLAPTLQQVDNIVCGSVVAGNAGSSVSTRLNS
jgi:hypothetical protein